MPRELDPASQASLDSGRVVERGFIVFDFGTDGVHAFWTGIGPYSYEGVDYVGAGSLLSVEAPVQNLDLSAKQITVKLRAIPDTDLSPDVLATIEDYDYHQKPCTIGTMYFDPDSYALLSLEPEYRGYVDQVTHSEAVGGECVLTGLVESKFRDHQKSGYRTRSDLDQRRINALDDSMRHVATVATEKVTFGRSTQAPFVPKKKSFLSRIFG